MNKMNKTSIKVVARGKRIYKSMDQWLRQRPWSGQKARSSMTPELMDAVFGAGNYRMMEDDSYTPAQNGMGCVLDRPARESHKTVLRARSLARIYDLLAVWGCKFLKNLTTDGEFQKWTGPSATVTLKTVPDRSGEYWLTVV